MLVIPAIEIKNCHCLRTVASNSSLGREVYTDDPAEMAYLWRKENAKTLHVTDYDGLYDGHLDNFEEIISVVRRVEIPVQLVTRFESVEECERWLDGGVYRLIVHDLIQRDPDGVRSLIERHGRSRISAGAITKKGRIDSTWRETERIDSTEFAVEAERLGVGRLFFTDRDYEGVLSGPNIPELRRIAASTTLHVTAAGGVASVEHLWMLQEMESLGIDSVVIGRAFYENRFPCQELWRDVEVERMRNAGTDDAISTSALAARAGRPPGEDGDVAR
jgi:phosphoribosylformimino-5-aminoimidazole carboxamide ribotide isomerase